MARPQRLSLWGVATACGWVVEYLVYVRHGSLSQMRYMSRLVSMAVLYSVRLLLAEPTHRFGELQMILLYCLISISLQLIFRLYGNKCLRHMSFHHEPPNQISVPNIIAASIAISLIGLFTGPLLSDSQPPVQHKPVYLAGHNLSLGSRIFPRHVHSTALALVFVFAQMGGSLFPIITGCRVLKRRGKSPAADAVLPPMGQSIHECHLHFENIVGRDRDLSEGDRTILQLRSTTKEY
ncbi:hypothetical protein ED733_000004, partial [Metarhizium rileyi]